MLKLYVFMPYRISLPEFELQNTWSFQNSFKTILTREKCLISKPLMLLERQTMSLHKINTRSSLFSELQSYWQLPIHEMTTVVALSVSPGLPMTFDDTIRILTANPLCLWEMTLESQMLHKFCLDGLMIPYNNQLSSYKLTTDRAGQVIIYEETVNILESTFFN